MMYDALIVGAGPAGASCALWLQQLGFHPLLLDQQEGPGGLQRRNAYSNTWIASSFAATGASVTDSIDSNLKRFDVATRYGLMAHNARRKPSPDGDVWAVDLMPAGRTNVPLTDRSDQNDTVQARHLVIAAGTRPRSGGLDHLPNVFIGSSPQVAALEFKNRRVAVLGGGDNAMENALFAADRGAHVHVFARSIKARAAWRHKLDRPQIQVTLEAPAIDPISGSINGTLYDTVLVMYGYEAAPGADLGLPLARTGGGLLATALTYETNLESVFAIGEIAGRTHPCCATAMAEGVIVAKRIQAALEGAAITSWEATLRRGERFSSGKMLDTA